MYTKQEVNEVQDLLSSKRKLSEPEIRILQEQFAGKQIPQFMLPFLGLFATNPDLYEKISGDRRVEKYSLFGFFPESFDIVYGNEKSPEISFEGRNRGIVAIIKHPAKNIVIKPMQNSRENEVAGIAAELEVGPRQYRTLDGFLTEQFVEGDLFSRLTEEKKSRDSVYLIGRRLGEILKKLHSKGIYYNDAILTDDSGRSHLIVPETMHAILFDYGVAIKLDKHPNLSDEEVFNYARTFPVENMFLSLTPTKEKIDALVQNYRPKIKRLTKEQIMGRDLDFVDEGLGFAGIRLGNHIIEPFIKGFKETYF